MTSLKELHEEEIKNSPYVQLKEDGDVFEGVFKKVEKVSGQYGETYKYTFETKNNDGDVVRKELTKGSWRLFNGLFETGAVEGDLIRITIIGEAYVEDKNGNKIPNKDRDFKVERIETKIKKKDD